MTKQDLYKLVDQIPDDLVDGTATFLRRVVRLHIDPEQLWYWTPEWQAKEREVDETRARGERGHIYNSDEEFLAVLDDMAERR